MIRLDNDIEKENLVHFSSLLNYQNETNFLGDKEFFKTAVLKMKDSFLKTCEDFEQVKSCSIF